MSALQLLSSYLAEVVKEILRVVEDTVTEYREEAARTRRENQTLRSQLRDVLLLEARAEWPRAGPIPSFSLEQLSLSENSTSAVTPPTRRSVPAPQEPVVFLDAQQDSEDKPERTDRKQLLSIADAHGNQSERTAEGPRASAETPAPVTVKEEPEERSLTESDQEETDHRAECCRNTEEEEEADEEDGAQWRRDKDDEGGDWRDPEPGLRPKPEPEPPSATRTEPPQTTAPQACLEPHSAPRCPRCSETFPSPVALLQHLHQQKKTHRCHFCCKSFSQSADLRRHHRTHTGERPHRCSFCSRAFSQRGNLRRHLRIHTGERPYACTHCLRRFSDGDTLKKHLRTHGPARTGLQQD